MTNELQSNNVRLTGEILTEPKFSHEMFGEEFFELTIAVKRLSDQCDILPLTVSQHLLSENRIVVGQTVSVVGQFRSYNKVKEEKSRLMLTVFVREFVEVDEQVNPNSIELVGYICKQPVYRTTPFNREICDMLVAVNRQYNKSDYIPCIAWGRNARFVKYLSVGEQVAVFGRIQSREYQKRMSDDQTETKIAYEVSLSRIVVGDKIQELESQQLFSLDTEQQNIA